MQRNPICLLDKYCHIYKRIFIFEGKSSYNVDLPSCILYNSTPPKKKKLSEQTRCLQLFDWTEKCQNLVTAHGRVSIALVFWSQETWQFFVLRQCLSFLFRTNSEHGLLCLWLQDEHFSLMFSYVITDYKCKIFDKYRQWKESHYVKINQQLYRYNLKAYFGEPLTWHTLDDAVNKKNSLIVCLTLEYHFLSHLNKIQIWNLKEKSQSLFEFIEQMHLIEIMPLI